jgi:hypothetical protein
VFVVEITPVIDVLFVSEAAYRVEITAIVLARQFCKAALVAQMPDERIYPVFFCVTHDKIRSETI